MTKKSVASLSAAELTGKKVLVRADFNVPVDDSGKITDDTRIRAALPTIQDLIGKGAIVILCSHFGRPKGVDEKLRLTPVSDRLSELLGQTVVKCNDCIGDEVASKVAAMTNGQVALLENVRFYPEEEKNDPEFAKKLASIADLYVNDAFGTAHRAHASTEGVTKYLKPSVAGYLIESELKYLQGAIESPQRPLAAIVGGSKVSSKIGVIETLLARALEAKAKEKGVQLILPTDVVVADNFSPDANAQTVDINNIPDGWMGLDIGPDSIEAFQAALADCKSVIWNGPMGVFEFPKFAAGTEAIAHTLADISATGAITIIGGGDSVAAVEQVGLADKMSHISTGGGASLELLEGKILPGIAALDEA
jgi:phosphoglycerate kinase